ncbi:hypothetical protein RvY_14683 [Ramazzottius varieornatus]|uniref:Uncharacterized protein n=1 Tax=Ramazzottius varieornatus TaxID=947166 RepID=A0A1D1W0I5_RAMVA|nr:hypothetical protein RvY_14683 [Ramazzottius varieornatus]
MDHALDTARILTDSELEQAEYTEGEVLLVDDSSDILSNTANYSASPSRSEPLEIFQESENQLDELFHDQQVYSETKMLPTQREPSDLNASTKMDTTSSFHIPNVQDALTSELRSMNGLSSTMNGKDAAGRSGQNSADTSLNGSSDHSAHITVLKDAFTSLFRAPATPRLTYKSQALSPRTSMHKRSPTLLDDRHKNTPEARRARSIRLFHTWNAKRKRQCAGMEELLKAVTWQMYTSQDKRFNDYDPFKLPLDNDFKDYRQVVRRPYSLTELTASLVKTHTPSAFPHVDLTRIPCNAIAYNHAHEPIANEAQKMLSCITRITKLASFVNAEINDLSDLGVDHYRHKLQAEVARTKAKANGKERTSTAAAVDRASASRRRKPASTKGPR